MSKTNESQLNLMLKYYLAEKDSNTNQEIEAKFGTRGFRNLTIGRADFENVIKKLKSSGFYSEPVSDLLRIQNEFIDEKRGKTNLSNIRTEVTGITQIQKYCNDNSVLDKDMAVMRNVQFVQKTIKKVDNKPIYPINYDDFNFRISYSTEKKLPSNIGLIQAILSKWNDSRKVYRLLSRSTFINSKYPMRVDCSIVKSSMKENRKYVPTYTIKDSKIFTQNPSFEIEIELDNDKIDALGLTNVQIAGMLRQVIKIVMSGLQQTNFPISYVEQEDVRIEYMDLIHEKESDKKKKKKDKKDKESKYEKYKRILPKDFIGPSSYTLQMENIVETAEENGVVSIRQPYTVTDKADGMRKLLFISGEGRIYLIDTNMNIQYTGAIVRDEIMFDSLLDGEHILTNKYGDFINLYAAFDIYYIKGKDIRAFPFVNIDDDDEPTKFRRPMLHEYIKALKHVSIVDKGLSPIRIEAKKFYISKESGAKSVIFSACDKVLSNIDNDLMEYETDGIIFTPIHEGVGVTRQNPKPVDRKITWDLSFKWKPPQFNTIDFLISVKKEKDGRDMVKTIFEEGLSTSKTTEITQYKTLVLRVGFDERRHGYINPYADVLNDVKHDQNLNVEQNLYKPLPFYPTNPYDPNASVCNVIIEKDLNGIDQMYVEDKSESFSDNMIVEFRYEKKKDAGWRWIPIRVRHDKTDEFKKGLKNYGNAYHVAESNWKSIHTPVTLNMIRTGQDVPTEISDYNVYYNRKTSKSNTKSLRDFHNLYVKRSLITGVSRRGDTLIDLAVGKAGDLPKWLAAKLSFVFGIDVSRDNIENRLDGACARYLTLQKKTKIMPSALFVNGNSGMNIRNTDAMFTEKAKQVTNAVFGEGPKDETILGKGVYKQYGVAKKGFNICSCQFAAHYFFENTTTLTGFLRNVSECLSVDGYFIGTCFDGEKIFKLLSKREKGEGLVIYDNNEKICEMIKQYERDDFNDDSTSLGYSIDVYQETINKTFREYLVNFTFMTRVLENYGLVPITDEEATRMHFPSANGSFSDLFKKMNNDISLKRFRKENVGDAPNLSSKEKQISFLNRYFIFKKVRDVDADSVTLDVKSLKERIKEEKAMKGEEEQDKPVDDADDKPEDKGDDKPDDKQEDKKKVKKIKKKLVLKKTKPQAQEDKDKDKDKSKDAKESDEKQDDGDVDEVSKGEYIVKKGVNIEKFWSKSPANDKTDKYGTGYNDWQRRLSNFWEGDDDDITELTINDSKWPTIEHWFQANKFMYSDEEKYKYYVSQFKKGGKFDSDAGKGKGPIARSAGGKTATKRAKLVIDSEWDSKSYSVMVEGIQNKVDQFPDIKKILQVLKDNNVHIVHYETVRGATKYSHWGGKFKKQKDGSHQVIGENKLGKIYMQIMNKL